MVDVGEVLVKVGDCVVLWGDLFDGVLSVEDWVVVVDMIGYEIVMWVGFCVLCVVGIL